MFSREGHLSLFSVEKIGLPAMWRVTDIENTEKIGYQYASNFY